MKTLIVDNGTKHLQKLKSLLSSYELTVVPVLERYPKGDFDLIILSGSSKFSIYNNPQIYKNEIKLIKESTTPVIGICLGCELIAYTYGSEMHYSKNKVHGLKEIKVLKELTFFRGIKSFKVYEAHHWSITKLGKVLMGLARSKYGWEMIKVKKRNIYGLQFHPEIFLDKQLGDDLFLELMTSSTFFRTGFHKGG